MTAATTITAAVTATTVATGNATAAAAASPPTFAADRSWSPPIGVVAAAGGCGHAGVLAIRPASGTMVQDLLRQRAELPAGHADRATLRMRSIEAGLSLARCLAARYTGRGEPLDDLVQVAALALVRAVDGYDPARQAAFTSYAVPTIVGALKRHFRDTTWRVRVPRRVQELAITLAPATARLAHQLGRSPTLPELAAHLDASEDDVAIAVRAWQAHHPDSLDAPSATGGQERLALIDTLGAVDARLDAVIDRRTLQPLLAALPIQQRRILAMRFFGDMTQAQIAARIGVSQMQISRLLVRTLTQLRTGMLAEQPLPSTRRPAPDQPAAQHG
jgi:RNA polymerase sigma-B factor